MPLHYDFFLVFVGFFFGALLEHQRIANKQLRADARLTCTHDYTTIERTYTPPLPSWDRALYDNDPLTASGFTTVLCRCDACGRSITERLAGKPVNDLERRGKLVVKQLNHNEPSKE